MRYSFTVAEARCNIEEEYPYADPLTGKLGKGIRFQHILDSSGGGKYLGMTDMPIMEIKNGDEVLFSQIGSEPIDAGEHQGRMWGIVMKVN